MLENDCDINLATDVKKELNLFAKVFGHVITSSFILNAVEGFLSGSG